ncbi:MinD/ParA family protein [Marinobacter sp.]|uniref:MinD/ParA family ATP-binding protein n=1 Tax=Marinobacter sp. TaxID=50741 RepID=UPI0035668446
MALDPDTDKHDSNQPHTVAIAGGAGGVGKTSVALNLALALARQGKRVLLLDGDTGLSSLTARLGLGTGKGFSGVFEAQFGLEEALVTSDYDLNILPGAADLHQCLDMDQREAMTALEALDDLEHRYDYVLVDTGSGTDLPGLHMVASAALACLVVTPDPESLKQVFSLVRNLRKRGYRRVPSVVVNMASGASQAQSIFQRLDGAVGRHLGDSLHYLGAVWRDETLRQSVVTGVPVATLPVSDPSCRQFHTLADMLDVRLSRLPPEKSGMAGYWQSVLRRRHRTGLQHQEETVERPRSEQERLSAAMDELDAILGQRLDPMLRYEAFNRFFALLGRNLDADSIEFIQTGLAAMPWEKMPPDDRQHMATHLRHLADQIAPPEDENPKPAAVPAEAPEPLFDRISLGEQERLVRALREQPADVSIDQLLRALASHGTDRF